MQDRINNFIKKEYCLPIKSLHGVHVSQPDKYSVNSIQFIAINNDEIVGYVRIIIGKNNQITTESGVTLEKNQVELSRLIVSKEKRGDESIMFLLLYAAHEYAVKNKISLFVVIAHLRIEKIFSRYKYEYKDIAKDFMYFGKASNILEWNIGDAFDKLSEKSTHSFCSSQVNIEIIEV
jgi:hypothetical protein